MPHEYPVMLETATRVQNPACGASCAEIQDVDFWVVTTTYRMMKNKDVVDFVVGDDPEEGTYVVCALL